MIDPTPRADLAAAPTLREAERQRFKIALEEICRRADHCERNMEFRRGLGWYEDTRIQALDKTCADAWREAARIASEALSKEGQS